MFSVLSGKLSAVFDKLTGRGRLSVADVDAALTEIRSELLEADVALSVIKPFLQKIRERAVGDRVLQSITPGQQVVKIVNDELVALLGGSSEDMESASVLDFKGEPPHVILLAGLQGSGKTTTAAKLARYLATKQRQKILLASLDTARPAAQEQLRILGQQIDCATLPIVAGQLARQIAERALSVARFGGYDIVILDSAGRLQIDAELMRELQDIKARTQACETLLVADALMGQSAAEIASQFHQQIILSGIILTRIDGDGRGGAALSMRAVSHCPIRFLGTGERVDDFELFQAKSMANRILGMGDIVSLVGKAEAAMSDEDAQKLAHNLEKGRFTMDDMARQLKQVRKIGGMQGIMSLMPGMAAAKAKMPKQLGDEKALTKSDAIISSMTPKERQNPKIIHASRKCRIASGSGTAVQDVNKLLKQHLMMSKMVKKLQRMDKREATQAISSLMGGQNFQ